MVRKKDSRSYFATSHSWPTQNCQYGRQANALHHALLMRYISAFLRTDSRRTEEAQRGLDANFAGEVGLERRRGRGGLLRSKAESSGAKRCDDGRLEHGS